MDPCSCPKWSLIHVPVQNHYEKICSINIIYTVLSFTMLLFLNTKEVEAASSNDATSLFKGTLKFEVDENNNAKLKKLILGMKKNKLNKQILPHLS
ncbi:hypothetical protein MOE15_21490 [Bacillus atrophaeus]|uniref:hypothetical protein n=1 Tax=Bacillus atrophaeus TaxID=1452 RepID=UPI002281DD44|nr:hypothetical protein [Bacillus atrophaeus]MCY8810996.1 hypothetical protein [Bacillus atrophaeus]